MDSTPRDDNSSKGDIDKKNKSSTSGNSTAAKGLVVVLLVMWFGIAALLMGLEQTHPHEETHTSPHNHPHLRHTHTVWEDVMTLDGFAQASLPIIEEFAAEKLNEIEEEKVGTIEESHSSDELPDSSVDTSQLDSVESKVFHERIVAIGDIHGDLSALKRALHVGGVLCASAADLDPMRRGPASNTLCDVPPPDSPFESLASATTPTRTVVVQIGDLVDGHGQSDRETLDYVAALREKMMLHNAEVEAEASRDFVAHHLSSNTTEAAARAKQRRQTYDLQMILGNRDVQNLPKLWPASADRVVPQTGFGSRAPHSLLPPWMRVASLLGGEGEKKHTLFVHGSLLEDALDAAGGDIDSMNAVVAAWLGDHRKNGIFGSREPSWLRTSKISPIWSRLFGSGGDSMEKCAMLRRVLNRLGAKRIVVGHTIQPQGISSMQCPTSSVNVNELIPRKSEEIGYDALNREAEHVEAWRIDVGLGMGQGKAGQVGASQILEISTETTLGRLPKERTVKSGVRVISQREKLMPQWRQQ